MSFALHRLRELRAQRPGQYVDSLASTGEDQVSFGNADDSDGQAPDFRPGRSDRQALESEREASDSPNAARLQPRTFVGPNWIDGEVLAVLPESLQGLVCAREGWTPLTWVDYLCTKADRCEELHPQFAERYRAAARMLFPGPERG